MVQAKAQKSAGMERCISDCVECHRACLEQAIHCMGMGGEHAGSRHQTLLRDCAEVCRLSADFLIRGSTFHAQLCRVSAEVCEACAEDNENLEGADEAMRATAAVCRRCAQSCREMAGRM